MAEKPHVVVLGAGFGGIGAAQKLRDAPVRLTIVDKHDYHTFQPLLYQVATDELGPAEVGYPVRELLHRHTDWAFHKCGVQSIDLAKKQVFVEGMPPLAYDYLVLALGAVVNFHGTPGAAEHSLPLYTMADAIRLHDHILKMFEAVDKNPALADDGALDILHRRRRRDRDGASRRDVGAAAYGADRRLSESADRQGADRALRTFAASLGAVQAEAT